MTAPKDGPGTLADLNNSANDPEHRTWFEQAAGRGSSIADNVMATNDLRDQNDPPAWTAQMIKNRAELLQTIASPGDAFLNNGLGFLVSLVISPLVELAEWAIGDPQQMRATGEGWVKVGEWLDGVAEKEAQRAESTSGVWSGDAGDKFRGQMKEFTEGVKALSADIKELKETLNLIADLFDMFVEMVVDIITEMVITLIVEWLAALAASWITAGASVVAAEGGTVATMGATGGRIAMKIKKLQGELFKLVKRLEELLQKIRKRLPEGLLKKFGDLRGGKIFDSNVANKLTSPLQKAVGRQIDGVIGPGGKIISRAGADGVSTTANRFMKDATGESALAANLAQEGLKLVGLSGQRPTTAAFSSLTGSLFDMGVDHVIDKSYETATEGVPQSEQERKDAQRRGFDYE
ncbi:hypothetical protein ABZ345_25800 [Lentzea sp. NPDC005914]|uniref:WXG100 family type VII secretion target n=1 Tax=Lentzea sp. NPDC005914 TaxID=3154572 RepID=UPI003402291E